MARNIFDVVVNKISLLTGEHEPAVEKAGTKFAILKSNQKKRLQSLYKKLEAIEQQANTNDIENKQD